MGSKASTITGLVAFFAPVCVAGCATVPKIVNVPVMVECPKPPVLNRPALAIQFIPAPTMTTRPTPADVVGAYVETVEQLTGYTQELETIIKGYK